MKVVNDARDVERKCQRTKEGFNTPEIEYCSSLLPPQKRKHSTNRYCACPTKE